MYSFARPGYNWFRIQFLDQWETDEKNPGMCFVEGKDLSHALKRFENNHPHATPTGPTVISVMPTKAHFMYYHDTDEERSDKNKGPCSTCIPSINNA
jgi:hypothetical protein